jgi:hypothetical protein
MPAKAVHDLGIWPHLVQRREWHEKRLGSDVPLTVTPDDHRVPRTLAALYYATTPTATTKVAYASGTVAPLARGKVKVRSSGRVPRCTLSRLLAPESNEASIRMQQTVL